MKPRISVKETGWEIVAKKDRKYIRPVRDHDHGLTGQEIWYELVKLGFVGEDGYKSPASWENRLTSFEQKLKNWLIWGYFEKDRKMGFKASNQEKRVNVKP